MFAARLAHSAPEKCAPPAAGLPTAVLLRQAWANLWWSVRTHTADLHGLPRPQPPR